MSGVMVLNKEKQFNKTEKIAVNIKKKDIETHANSGEEIKTTPEGSIRL